MISFRWPYLPVGIICFLVGVLAGLLWHLPFDQASTLAGLIVGLLVGAIGIAATLWVAARDRELKLGEIQRDVAALNAGLLTLQTTAEQMWNPMLTTMLARFGTGSQPATLSSITQEESRPAPGEPPATEQQEKGGPS